MNQPANRTPPHRPSPPPQEADLGAPTPGDLDIDQAIARLEETLHYYLDIRVRISRKLVQLMSAGDAAEVEKNLKNYGILGCEALYLPTIQQRSVDGHVLKLALITIDKKGNRLGEKQSEVVSRLLEAGFPDEIACPIFFYPTGAIMAVSFQPNDLAKMIYAYAIERTIQ